MTSGAGLEGFRELMQHPTVVGFAQQTLVESYCAAAGEQSAELSTGMQRAFRALSESCTSPAHFAQVVADLRQMLFQDGHPDFWFNRIYKHYKQQVKPARRFAHLRPWLRGSRVLDLGCGDGLTALALQRSGMSVHLADVLDYRDPAARHLPFTRMSEAGVFPFRDEHFDTAILMAVLHHVEAEDLPVLLSGLHCACRRVIVEEDSYGLAHLATNRQALLRDAHLRTFLGLSLDDQLRFLKFVDYFANAITQGLAEMDMPFNFKPVGEWEHLFHSHGFHIRHVQVMGFQPGFFNRSCHVWFILDAKLK